MPLSPTLSYCASLTRAQDRDRYLCTLFAPAGVREAWFALFAFNYEIAAIPEIVSEEMLGFVRYAWWREALDEIYAGGPVRKHPVVEALAKAVSEHALARSSFDAIIAARQNRFIGEEMTDPGQWERYFRDTSSELLALCAQAAGIAPNASLEALGIAWGALGTARNGQNRELLLALGEARLREAAQNLPDIFLPFRDTLVFYVKEMKKGKPVGISTALLTFSLCRKYIMRRFMR